MAKKIPAAAITAAKGGEAVVVRAPWPASEEQFYPRITATVAATIEPPVGAAGAGMFAFEEGGQKFVGLRLRKERAAKGTWDAT